jgi:hypothetical protein
MVGIVFFLFYSDVKQSFQTFFHKYFVSKFMLFISL